MKKKILFRCTQCQHEEPKWLGRCPECGNWNSLTEIASPQGRRADATPRQIPIPLNAVESRETPRFDAGMAEVNRVLGGGIMKGSSILIGGEPGIGKSTLMLQLAACVKSQGRVLYITGEESPEQIRIRSQRLGVEGTRSERIEVFAATEISQLTEACEKLKPVVVIVDSIQTLYAAEVGTVPGTVNQIKICSQELIDWCKRSGSALFLVGHVTKEGAIAGPKVIEHMVDTVLYFDSGSTEIRLLRSSKNRFGPIDEVGIFRMTDCGLEQVSDPSRVFLIQRQGASPPGVTVTPVYEGSRVLLVEIQSLVVPAKGGISRVFSERIDSGRVSRMAAVLEKHLKMRFSDQDLYVNVGGGMRLAEVGIELPLCLALYSARINQSLPEHSAVVGEVSLAGEVRPVSHLDRRLRTVQEMGFQRLIHPVQKGGAISEPPAFSRPVESVSEAVRSCFSGR